MTCNMLVVAARRLRREGERGEISALDMSGCLGGWVFGFLGGSLIDWPADWVDWPADGLVGEIDCFRFSIWLLVIFLMR